jgi:hypothetical protein
MLTAAALLPTSATLHSASPCSVCPGDTRACIGEMGLLGSNWQDRERKNSGPSLKGKKNLYTNPGRRGGMGYSHAERTIGQNPPEYMPDTYQYGRQLGRELRRKARERFVKPFNSAPNRGNGVFTENAALAAPPGPTDVERSRVERMAGKKAFLPSNPPLNGAAYCSLSKVGRDYMSSPVHEPEVRPRAPR